MVQGELVIRKILPKCRDTAVWRAELAHILRHFSSFLVTIGRDPARIANNKAKNARWDGRSKTGGQIP
jgi:hypothetical protein